MKYKLILLFSFLVFLAACKTSDKSLLPNKNFIESGRHFFTLSEAVYPPPEIQSLQLFPERKQAGPPIINIQGSEQLVLSFDYLSKQAKQFRVSISHRNQNWSKSPLPPTAFTTSFFETYFGSGTSSFANNPSYRHYEYRFPNKRSAFTKSGNYLLSVFDYNSGDLLFRIPFFVTEDEGTFKTELQTLFAWGDDGASLIQPFTTYHYPPFVNQPRFDLSAGYVPNQFWGRTKTADQVFYAGNKIIRFHLGRNQSFLENYGINNIDLRKYPPQGREVLEFMPGKTPPVVILKRDVQPFSAISSILNPEILGPFHDRQSQYFSVHFRFEPADEISSAARLYIVGDFTNWSIDERYRMRFDASDSLWKGNALIKQGVYNYKYVLLKNGRIDDMSIHKGFSNTTQYVLTFIYYRDPQLHYDRLLKVGKTRYK